MLNIACAIDPYEIVREASMHHVSVYRINPFWMDEFLNTGKIHSLYLECPRSFDREDTLVLIPDYMTSGDYCGSSVETANRRAFLGDFENRDGIFRISFGFSSESVGLLLSAYLDDDIQETLNSLSDYPVLDDTVLCEVETELSDEAWEMWARDDFRKGIAKSLGVDEDEVSEEESSLLDAFEELRDSANEYWIYESGTSAYIDLDRIIERAPAERLRELLVR